MNKFFTRLLIIIVFSFIFIFCAGLSFWWAYRMFKMDKKREAANFSRNGFFGTVALVALIGMWIVPFPWNEILALAGVPILLLVYWNMDRLIKIEANKECEIFFAKVRAESKKMNLCGE